MIAPAQNRSISLAARLWNQTHAVLVRDVHEVEWRGVYRVLQPCEAARVARYSLKEGAFGLGQAIQLSGHAEQRCLCRQWLRKMGGCR